MILCVQAEKKLMKKEEGEERKRKIELQGSSILCSNYTSLATLQL